MDSKAFLDTLCLLQGFVNEECIPNEALYFQQLGEGNDRWRSVPPIMETLKKRAKELGLWNLFLTQEYKEGAKISNAQYSILCEWMGRSFIAPEACNCSAPDTGNMEVLAKYGTEEQKNLYLKPLLEGKVRSAFAMTEPGVASSDATNISLSIQRQGEFYVLNGTKWWISGAMHPQLSVFLVFGCTDPNSPQKYRRHSVVIVPSHLPGITLVRPLTLFGYDDAPFGHVQVKFDHVRVPVSNVVLGEGRGFEVVQGRLGPGRLHHCMRAVGLAERALEALITRVKERYVFGNALATRDTVKETIGNCRIEIEAARLLVMKAAEKIDQSGAKKAQREIAMAKVVVPKTVCNVLDRAIQLHGAHGLGPDNFLAYGYAMARTLRIADGPDEVHLQQLGKRELELHEQKKSSKL